MKKQWICSAFVFLVLVAAWLWLTSAPATSQGEVTYYVFDDGGPCYTLMDGEEPLVPGDVVAELDPFEWYEIEWEGETGGAHQFVVCASSGVSHTVEYDMYGYGEGGFYIAWDIYIRVDTDSGYIDRDHDSAGGSAGCHSGSGGIDGTADSDLTGLAGGWLLMNNVSVNTNFCSADPYSDQITRVRAWGYGSSPPDTPTPTETPSATQTPTPWPTFTPSPCPDGYVYENGQCVDAACVGVSCDPGEVCIDGTCVDEDDLPGRMDAYVCLNSDPGLTSPGWWQTTGVWPPGYDYVRLRGGEYVRYTGEFALEGGPYRFLISARTCNYPALTYPLYDAGGNEYDWYVEDDCNWNMWSVIKTFPEMTNINLGFSLMRRSLMRC